MYYIPLYFTNSTVNKAYYLGLIFHLREPISGKELDLWKDSLWNARQNISSANTLLFVSEFLTKNNTEMTPQPSYSADMVT